MPSETDPPATAVPAAVHPTALETTPERSEKKRYFEPTDETANEFDRTANAHSNPGIRDALETITLDDFKKVHQQPCFREANLSGMGAGFAVGGSRFIFGGNVPKACNWAVGSFCLTSIACYELCQHRRKKERIGMLRAAEIIEAKRIEREALIAEKREQARQARQAREAAAAAEAALKKPSWKFW